jgi:hypothetical protein
MTKYKKEKAMRHTSKYYNIYKRDRDREIEKDMMRFLILILTFFFLIKYFSV